jgi:L-ascorbate metabolism protein UlaG (beta-lactamase superfamily)
MKITKYPQSHLVIENNGQKILIDPGNITFQNGFTPEQFQGMDGYLITHQHADHVDPDNIKKVVGESKVYGNQDVADKLKEFGVEVEAVRGSESFKIGEFEVTPIDLPHCPPPPGADFQMPPNTGFIINGVLFHPGDGYAQPGDLMVENVALPITGPTITEESALKFAQDLQAKVVVPIHYNSRFQADPEHFKQEAEKAGMEVRILNFGESTEI